MSVQVASDGLGSGPMSDDELTAVTAHWLLGRLTVIRSTASHLLGNDDVAPETRDLLLARCQDVMAEMQRALEDMARGLPPMEMALRSAHLDDVADAAAAS